jgi:hypothetical protein
MLEKTKKFDPEVPEATMLEKIKKFDPEVPGLILWPVMFGTAFAFGLLIVTR